MNKKSKLAKTTAAIAFIMSSLSFTVPTIANDNDPVGSDFIWVNGCQVFSDGRVICHVK